MRTVICGTKRPTIMPIAPYVHSCRPSTIHSDATIDARRRIPERLICQHGYRWIPASVATCACLPSPAPVPSAGPIQKIGPQSCTRAHRKFTWLGLSVAKSWAATEEHGSLSSLMLILRSLAPSCTHASTFFVDCWNFGFFYSQHSSCAWALLRPLDRGGGLLRSRAGIRSAHFSCSASLYYLGGTLQSSRVEKMLKL